MNIPPCPQMNPRRPYDEDEPDGMLVSDEDHIDDNLNAVRWFLDHFETFRGRLLGLVEAYSKMGSDAERAGDCRRAASYRSVANMLGFLVQGGEPVAVDFLARYPREVTK